MKKATIIQYTIYSLLVILSFACANRGQGPTGGAKDETPPKFLKSFPVANQKNVDKKKIELYFDENIKLKEVGKNVIISPPQFNQPQIQAYLRKVVVNLKDTLLNNTTYSIDFGQAITDNNEGNILENMVFSFSTGNSLDTMRISGTLLDAENLNTVKGVNIGIIPDLSDSAILEKPFSRIARTDENGKFTIYNIKKGKYRIYALEDKNRDNKYQRGEAIAFDTNIYQTSVKNYLKPDTVWKDSLTIDTIRFIPTIKYQPDTILLKFFHEKKQRQYLVKAKRKTPYKISLIFNTKADTLPTIKPLNCNWKDVLIEHNSTLDTINYWLADSTLIKKDTILLQVDYMETDTTYNLISVRDTIRFVNKKKRKNRKNTKKKSLLEIKTNIQSKFDIYAPLQLNFDVPIKNMDKEKIHLYQYFDTIPKEINYIINKKDKVGKQFEIKRKWKPETQYTFTIDSAAIINIFEQHNDKLDEKFKIKSETEYSNLKLKLIPFDSTAVFQLVNKEDKVVRTVKAQPNGTKITYVEPNEYFIRIFLDKNNNGKWDTGNFLQQLQPEPVFYYSKKLTLTKNWDFEETIHLDERPITKQKPKEILKIVNAKGEVQESNKKRN